MIVKVIKQQKRRPQDQSEFKNFNKELKNPKNQTGEEYNIWNLKNPRRNQQYIKW